MIIIDENTPAPALRVTMRRAGTTAKLAILLFGLASASPTLRGSNAGEAVHSVTISATGR